MYGLSGGLLVAIVSMLSKIISHTGQAYPGDTFCYNELDLVLHKSSQIVYAKMALRKYCKYHECTSGYFPLCDFQLAVIGKDAYTAFSTVMKRGNDYNLLYYVMILNLSFASLHKKEVFISFAWFTFLLSVPFEDIFQTMLLLIDIVF